MNKPEPLNNVRLALQQLSWQLFFLVPLTLVLWIFIGKVEAISALVGAAIVLLGQIFFVSRAFRYAGAQAARQIVKEFFRGEAGKFFITALLFAAVLISFKEISAGWLLTGFILQQLVSLLALTQIKSN